MVYQILHCLCIETIVIDCHLPMSGYGPSTRNANAMWENICQYLLMLCYAQNLLDSS